MSGPTSRKTLSAVLCQPDRSSHGAVRPRCSSRQWEHPCRSMVLYPSRLWRQATPQHAGAEAALGENVSACRAAPTGVAAHHVLHLALQGFELQAHEIQRHVERALQMMMLEFAGQPHIEPLAAAGDDAECFAHIYPVQH